MSSKKTPKPVKGKSAPKRPVSPPKPKLAWRVRLWSAVQSRLVKVGPEAWGVTLVLASLILTLFLVGAGGPVGEAVKIAISYLFGQWSALTPLALLGMGLVLVLGKPALSKRRLFFGVMVFFFSTLGLFHLLTGASSLASGAEVIGDRGGAVGALIAFPLQRTIGYASTFVILVGGVTLSILLVSRTPLKEFFLALGEVLMWAPRAIRRRRSLSRISQAVALSAEDSSSTVVRAPAKNAGGCRRRRRQWIKRSVGSGPWPIAPVLEVSDTDSPVPEVEVSGGSEEAVETGGVAPGRPRLEVVGDPPSSDSDLSGQNGRVSEAGASAIEPASAEETVYDSRAAHSPDYQLPPLDLLSRGGDVRGNEEDLKVTAGALRKALADHGVDAQITGVVSGPSVTRFEIELAPGVKVQKLSALSNDIAYALATPDVRLLVPIPGRSAIGVEVPNLQRRLVRLGDILSSPQAKAERHPLVVGLGMDISGKACLLNLEELPHVLIAGATGAGKSSCINSMITSLLTRARPEDLKLILVDPKRVELRQYEGAPHLLTRVITDPKKAAEALRWVVAEMDRRYELLAEAEVRDISGYAAKWKMGVLDEEKFDLFPYLVVVVDELNDLMMVSGREVEMAIVRIAQMARAVGIHLVLATQRPSVNVITGVIKANVPSRLAFSVASQTDSRVILDSAGAEKLVGQGDMLVVTARRPRPQRIQGAWVDESEISRVVSWVAGQRRPDASLDEALDTALTEESARAHPQDDEDEELLRRAMELVVRSQLGSTSMLQRKLRVGFARAGRLMDILERRGVVGPSLGSKAREVLIAPDEWGVR